MCVGRGLSYIESLPSAPQEKEEDSAMGNPVAESSVILIFVCACIELARSSILHARSNIFGCKKPSVAL